MQQQTFYKQFHPLVLLTLAVLVSRNIGGELFQVELKFVRLNVDEPTELQMFFYQLKFTFQHPGSRVRGRLINEFCVVLAARFIPRDKSIAVRDKKH